MYLFRTLPLRKFNNWLSVAIIGLSLYIFVWPFLPDLTWRLHHLGGQSTPAQLTLQAKQLNPHGIPSQNTLVVPRLDVSQPIVEGRDLSALHRGVWHRPQTSTPNKGGNTVIVGHRFTYDGPSVFYNLDKLQIGDPIIAYWEGKEYDYGVAVIKVVPPSAIDVEAPTTSDQLTLYTCTPLWSAKDRLVVIAKPSGGIH